MEQKFDLAGSTEETSYVDASTIVRDNFIARNETLSFQELSDRYMAACIPQINNVEALLNMAVSKTFSCVDGSTLVFYENTACGTENYEIPAYGRAIIENPCGDLTVSGPNVKSLLVKNAGTFAYVNRPYQAEGSPDVDLFTSSGSARFAALIKDFAIREYGSSTVSLANITGASHIGKMNFRSTLNVTDAGISGGYFHIAEACGKLTTNKQRVGSAAARKDTIGSVCDTAQFLTQDPYFGTTTISASQFLQ